MFLSYHGRSFTRKNNWLNRISFVYSWMSCFCFIPQLLKDSISPSTLCSLLFALLFSFFIPLFCLPASRKGHHEGYRWTTRWRGNGWGPEGVRGVKDLLSPHPAGCSPPSPALCADVFTNLQVSCLFWLWYTELDFRRTKYCTRPHNTSFSKLVFSPVKQRIGWHKGSGPPLRALTSKDINNDTCWSNNNVVSLKSVKGPQNTDNHKFK